jgi:GT2 family glycosyltransferase
MTRTIAPAIAAVTLNFGKPDDTFDCVRSLEASEYPNLRIIVVDNGSSAEARERIHRELPKSVTFIQSDRNLGFAGGNNLGIRKAMELGARYVLLINNDAALKSDALRLMAETASRIDRLGILGGKILVANDAGPTAEIWSAGGWYSPLRASGYLAGLGETDHGQYEAASEAEFLPACMWLVPTDVFRSMGLLDEDFFLYAEDLDYSLRLRRAGYHLYYEPSVVCFHKVSRSHWRDRKRASPLLNYYTNRNRVLIARRWLSAPERALFYVYFAFSRALAAIVHADPSYCAGILDGLRGKTGAVSPRSQTLAQRLTIS